MQVGFGVMMLVVGVVCGSFLCCQVRRLRWREQRARQEKRKTSSSAERKTVSAAKHSKSGAGLGKWSVCMSCKKRLKWYENIPVVSWVALRGRCSGCGAKIGAAEILSEVGCGVMLAGLSTTIDIATAGVMEWAIWAVVVVLSLSLAFLAIYDGCYGELSSLCLTFSTICAIMVVILRQWSLVSVGAWSWGALGEVVGAGALLGGVYLVLYLVSRGRWVGDGDWILAGVIGLALGSPWLALLALLAANLLACVVMLPAVVRSKKRTIYLGPWLVAGFAIIYIFGDFLGNLI